MDITRTAYGAWNGGRFMRFGEPLSDDQYIWAIQYAYGKGVRTFVVSDVLGCGVADTLLRKALEGIHRDLYCLVGMIGRDFYKGGSLGDREYPRFTHPSLRGTSEYADYIQMATERALARCGVGHFDCLLLQDPDFTGFSNEAVWNGLERMKDQRLAHRLGIAPGPGNGFTLDMLLCFERFGALIDWAMVVLNPLEPWPGRFCLDAAKKHHVKLLARSVDRGGLFYGDVHPEQPFADEDVRIHWPLGWVKSGFERLQGMRPIAEAHGLTLLQLACLWGLSQPPVQSVIPTIALEAGWQAESIQTKIEELATIPAIPLPAEVVEEIARIGDNRGENELQGGRPDHLGAALPDRWLLTADLLDVAKRWGITPEIDLSCTESR